MRVIFVAPLPTEHHLLLEGHTRIPSKIYKWRTTPPKKQILATRSYPSNCICMKFRAKPPKFSRHVRRRPGGEELNYQSSHSFGTLKLWFQWWRDGWLVHWLVEISMVFDWLRFPLGWKMLDITIWKGSSLIKTIRSTSTWSDCLGRSHIKAHLLGCIGAVAMDPRVPGHWPIRWNTCAASWHHKPLSWRCVAAAWWVAFTPCMAGNTANWRFFGALASSCAFSFAMHFPCAKKNQNSVCWMTTPQRHVSTAPRRVSSK